MMRNLARVTVVLCILLLAFLNPAWGLFVIIGLTIRIAWSNRHTAVVQGVVYFIASLALAVMSFIAGILILLILLLAISLLFNSCSPAGGPRYESVEYKAYIEFVSANDTFLVKDEIIIPNEARIIIVPPPPSMREGMQEKPILNLEELMASKGWAYEGVVDGKPKYSRKREQKVLCSWFSSYTVNDISIPHISHEDIILEPNEQSKALLDVPKHLIVSTFPSSTPQSTLKGGRDLFVIDASSPVRAYPNLELGVVHPALRNEVGTSLIKTSVWTPVYWTVAALLLIFSKQIELGILMPIVRWLFESLGLKYRKEDDTPKESTTTIKVEKKANQANSKAKLNRRSKR